MADIFTRLTIVPSYAAGFMFIWDISEGFSDPLPWHFTVEEAETSKGDWEPISPELENIFAFSDSQRRVPGKDKAYIYRIKLTTPNDTYYSFEKHPYGDLTRREQLIARDVMRRTVLEQSTMAGVRVKLFIRSQFGARCTRCTDPITGGSASSNCRECYGTGKLPPYHGPYELWGTFTPRNRNPEMSPDGTGVRQVYGHQVTLVGYPFLKDRDILIARDSDKRYVIDGVQHLLEMRRIPVLQSVNVFELPTSDPVYRLATALAEQEGCVLP